MEYRIAVCDDSEADREHIAALAESWGGAEGRRARVDRFVSAESFLFCREDNGGYDILLLDVEMGAMDGVALAKELRRMDDAVQIVFITGYSDYIAEGYEVEALHYLVKPVDREKLFRVLDRAAEHVRRAERMLTLLCGGETVRIPLGRVSFADVRSNYVTVHAGTDYTVKMTLSELERQLDGRFFRVGRSAIVNLEQIARVTRTDVFLTDGTAVPLPRGGYEAVNRAIIAGPL